MKIGLDFGTSNSAVAINIDGNVTVVPVEGERVLPSLLYFKRNGELFVGQKAKESYRYDNRHRLPASWKEIDTGEEREVEIVGGNGIIYYSTTLRYKEDIHKPGKLVQSLKSSLREGFSNEAYIFEHSYSIEFLIATLLKELRVAVEKFTSEKVTEAVIGKPVQYGVFSSEEAIVQKRMTHAAYLAGFDSVAFMEEPIAAALSYVSRESEPTKVFVFDFGGGTLDFSVVDKEGNGCCSVIGVDGLPIGGDTFNEEIMMSAVAKQFGVYDVWGPKDLPIPAYIRHALRKWYELQSYKHLK